MTQALDLKNTLFLHFSKISKRGYNRVAKSIGKSKTRFFNPI